MSRQNIIDELHRGARKNFPRRKYVMKGLDETYQADLVEMIPYSKQNRNNKYILTVIDIFSKYSFAVPVKSKSSKDISKAMEVIFKTKRIPKNIHTDLGKEFFNKDFKKIMTKYKINHYNTYSTKKAAIVERFNRTLKNKMWKQFSLRGSYKWIDILPKLIEEYNNTKHRTIKMKPIDVNRSNEKNILETIYKKEIHLKTPKFKVNDHVRISKYKSLFEKGYTPNWTAEIFQIYKYKLTDPVTYYLKDYQQYPVQGCFYEQELQKVKYSDVYLVEKILRKRGNNVYVKWLGFDNNHNSWINENNIL